MSSTTIIAMIPNVFRVFTSCPVSLCYIPVIAVLDTAANFCALSSDLYKELDAQYFIRFSSPAPATAGNGTCMDVLFHVWMLIHIGDAPIWQEFRVMSSLSAACILGIDILDGSRS